MAPAAWPVVREEGALGIKRWKLCLTNECLQATPTRARHGYHRAKRPSYSHITYTGLHAGVLLQKTAPKYSMSHFLRPVLYRVSGRLRVQPPRVLIGLDADVTNLEPDPASSQALGRLFSSPAPWGTNPTPSNVTLLYPRAMKEVGGGCGLFCAGGKVSSVPGTAPRLCRSHRARST